ncbi:MAG: TonB-dependent receptor plug domain-containing protein, partial [Tannerella sp.]|nr:TonB-dependent receptor plug domain-containing protein [Tannerella sp.]
MDNSVLKEFFAVIESKTDYTFMYKNLDLNTPVSITAKQREIKEVLNQVFKDLNIRYEVSGKRIILSEIAVKDIQQEKKIVTGNVLDELGEPVVGANVVEKGTKSNGTVTDVDGKFSLNILQDATLAISYIGYVSQEIAVGNQTYLQITLTEDSKALDEVVVVGYGTVKKRDLTGAVASISAEKILAVPVTNAMQALQGNVPGVLVTTTDWSPGSTPAVLIRGKRSIKASNDPLYVVDGIPVTGGMGDLPPNEIESIDVLKDASATAIYGARGSNGVVLITTKRGKAGKAQVSYSGYVGAQTILNKIDLMNGS